MPNPFSRWCGVRRILLAVLLPVATAPMARAVTAGQSPDAIVAAGRVGAFATVQAAIDAAPAGRISPWVILIRPGVYREHVHVPVQKPWITLRGGPGGEVVITMDTNLASVDPQGRKLSTPESATALVQGDDFCAEDITFENTTPRERRIQALAMYVTADRAVFRRCRFLGWQDTLRLDSPRPPNTEPDTTRPAGNARQYLVDCYIEGHVDFIYAAGTAVLDRCHIHCKGDGFITAASTPPDAEFGYVFLDCRITGEAGAQTYLGRPWRNHAKTVFIRTEMTAVVHPAGWHNWDKPAAEQTTFFAEFGSTGPGANDAARVKWAKPLAAPQAGSLTANRVLAGADGWNPAGP